MISSGNQGPVPTSKPPLVPLNAPVQYSIY